MGRKLDEAIKLGAGTLREFGAREVYVFPSGAEWTLPEGTEIGFAVVGLPAESFYRAASGTMSATGRSIHLVDLADDTPFVRFLKEEVELEPVE